MWLMRHEQHVRSLDLGDLGYTQTDSCIEKPIQVFLVFLRQCVYQFPLSSVSILKSSHKKVVQPFPRIAVVVK
jgi:hypothetical protein